MRQMHPTIPEHNSKIEIQFELADGSKWHVSLPVESAAWLRTVLNENMLMLLPHMSPPADINREVDAARVDFIPRRQVDYPDCP